LKKESASPQKEVVLVLEMLDAILWSTLHHVYGEASDVPGLMGDLASLKKAIREAAAEAFTSNVYHQGTIYSTTASMRRGWVQLF
jgi:hypothetical protein